MAYVEMLRLDPCVYCGKAGGSTEHIEAVSMGGANHWTNYAGACIPCNSSKNAKPLISFLANGGLRG